VDCPFCGDALHPGFVKARGYAAVWRPAKARRSRLPVPYDVLTRQRRGESIVVGSSARPADRCGSCGAVVIGPESAPDR
jgi:hypothetical protein